MASNIHLIYNHCNLHRLGTVLSKKEIRFYLRGFMHCLSGHTTVMALTIFRGGSSHRIGTAHFSFQATKNTITCDYVLSTLYQIVLRSISSYLVNGYVWRTLCTLSAQARWQTKQQSRLSTHKLLTHHRSITTNQLIHCATLHYTQSAHKQNG